MAQIAIKGELTQSLNFQNAPQSDQDLTKDTADKDSSKVQHNSYDRSSHFTE